MTLTGKTEIISPSRRVGHGSVDIKCMVNMYHKGS